MSGSLGRTMTEPRKPGDPRRNPNDPGSQRADIAAEWERAEGVHVGDAEGLGLARGWDWAFQRQKGPTDRQREALTLRYFVVLKIGGVKWGRPLPRPASYEEVGFLMGISKQAANRLVRDGAAAAGINLSDLDRQ
jgi:hypothetical protein